jgi:DNA-binding GntR family transcriptional regulator
VVKRLLKAIFQGELPTGTRLVVKRLGEGLGISATPIREAMVQLEAVGLVQLFHNRGALVNPFGRDQLREFFHVRRILETEAARCASGQLEPAAIEALRREGTELLRIDGQHSSDWAQRAIACDRKLHDTVASHCGNTRLAYEIHRYDTLMQCLSEIAGDLQKFQQKELEEHRPILDAIAAKNADAAASAMSYHIESVGKAIESAIFQ